MKYELKSVALIVAIIAMLVMVATMSQVVIESNRNKNCICEEE